MEYSAAVEEQYDDLEVDYLDETSKQQRQEQHYVMLSEIQDMTKNIPLNLQQRLQYTTLSSLAQSLLDGTVFQIVQHLSEIQQMTERKLMEQRSKLHNSHKSQRQQMMKRHEQALQDSRGRPHNLPLIKNNNEHEKQALEQRVREEQQRMDERILIELDMCVAEQQNTLEKAGVPGFHRSKDPTEVRLQMYLLEFITKLHRKETEGSGS
ncbi:protein DGCR6-like [Diadema antillarum]|uniref:protein DGCR6-like n=1 Tax=Diadema antillarum TaxID=105358 RepID=UPI003A896FF2